MHIFSPLSNIRSKFDPKSIVSQLSDCPFFVYKQYQELERFTKYAFMNVLQALDLQTLSISEFCNNHSYESCYMTNCCLVFSNNIINFSIKKFIRMPRLISCILFLRNVVIFILIDFVLQPSFSLFTDCCIFLSLCISFCY